MHKKAVFHADSRHILRWQYPSIWTERFAIPNGCLYTRSTLLYGIGHIGVHQSSTITPANIVP